MVEQRIKSPELLQKVLNALPVGVWIIDEAGMIVQGNPACVEIWGGARLVGIAEFGKYKGWWASTGKRIEAEEWAAARAIMKGETSINEEVVIETFDNKSKVILNSAIPLRDSAGRIIGAIAVNEDITERKRKESELLNSKELLERVFSSVDLHIAYMDRDFNFIRVNRAYAEADGRPPEFFAGKNHFELYPNPENEAIFKKVVETGEPYYVYGKPFSYPEHPEKGVTWWDWSLQPVKEQNGIVSGLILSLVNVTEHKRAEEELKKHRERLGELVDESTAELKQEITEHWKTEERLERAVEALRERVQMLDMAHVFVWDLDGRICFWNTGCIRLYGWKKSEALGAIAHELLKTVFPEPLENIKKTLFETGSWEGELIQNAKDGRKVFVASHWTVHRDRHGTPVSVIEVNNDITELKRIEDELKISEETYRGLYESIRDGIHRTDMDGRILECNQAYADMLGYSKEEIKNLTYIQVTPEKWHKMEEDIVANKIIKDGYSDLYEKEYRRKDGTVFPINIKVWLLRDKQGNPEGMWGIVRDITEAKKADEAIKERELRFRTTAEAAADAIICIEDPGIIYFWNRKAEEIFGFSIKEALGKTLHEVIVPEEYRKNYADALKVFFITGKGPLIGKTTEVRGLRKDGSVFPVELSIGAMRVEEKWQAVGIVRDITERKNMENDLRKAKEALEEKVRERTAELERSNRELEQFAYIASHDLKEPLRMVSSYVQLLAVRYKGRLEKDADEFMDFALDGAFRMEVMITDLLEYSRVQTKAKPFEKIECETALAEAVRNLQMAVQENGAFITHDPLPAIKADPSQIVRVFQNLIGNAIKFRKPEEPPKIHVASEDRGNKWIFSVRDNGIGIEPASKEMIFTIFQRLHGRKYPGTGIGLAICKRIIERHGGEIWVESEPGKGSVFYFTIPKKN